MNGSAVSCLAHCNPTCRHHKASGQAVVTVAGRNVYVGPHGSKGSRADYDRAIGGRLANGRRSPTANLPGVDGERLDAPGDGHREWVVTGRLSGVDEPTLRQAIEAGHALQDSTLGTFADDRGQTYSLCQRVDYRPVGPFVPVTFAGVSQSTVRVRTTVQRLVPA